MFYWLLDGTVFLSYATYFYRKWYPREVFQEVLEVTPLNPEPVTPPHSCPSSPEPMQIVEQFSPIPEGKYYFKRQLRKRYLAPR